MDIFLFMYYYYSMKRKIINWDNYHYDGNAIDGCDKDFNAIISERELGKSSWIWVKKVFKTFLKEKAPCLVLRRKISDITDAYIDDIQECINKFLDTPIKFIYKKTSKEGVVDIYLNDEEDNENYRFIRIIAISNPMSRIKSLVLRNVKYMVFDEFICNTRLGEKYEPDEAFKFKEIFNTFQRESKRLRAYLLGNPYSMYNPYFVWWDVPTSELKPGCILTGKAWAVHCGVISDELRAIILKRNPLYKFDDDYKKYAFFGQAVNDINIRIVPKQPENYQLRFVFKINNKFIFFYKFVAKYPSGPYPSLIYWSCVKSEYISKNRLIFCFDFKDLVENTALMSTEDHDYFERLRDAIRFRMVGYETIEASYLAEEIYKNTR